MVGEGRRQRPRAGGQRRWAAEGEVDERHATTNDRRPTHTLGHGAAQRLKGGLVAVHLRDKEEVLLLHGREHRQQLLRLREVPIERGDVGEFGKLGVY